MNEVMFNEGIEEREAVQRGNPRSPRKGSLANLQLRASSSILKVGPPTVYQAEAAWLKVK